MTALNQVVLSHSSIAGWALLLFAIVWTLQTARSKDTSATFDWKWWLLIAGVLLCFRWPLIWLLHELYPDESQLIAGAITLRHDPVFWRSVDGATAGPLDYYFLLPAAFGSGATSYALARLMAIGAIWGALVAMGETLSLITSRLVARAAVLPFVVFESLTTNPEFVHYSTELVPGLMLAVAAYAIARQATRPSPSLLWFAGVVLGAVPFAKLQATPLAGVLWIFLAILEAGAGRKKNLTLLLLASLSPTLMAAIVATFTGQTENVLIPYILYNMEYIQGGRQSIGSNLMQQGQQIARDGYLALWLAGTVVFLPAVAAFARNPPKSLRLLTGASALLLATAIVCVFAPGRPYNHYLNLAMLPLTLVLGSASALILRLDSAPSARRCTWWIAMFLACCVAPQIALRASHRPDPFENYNRVMTAPGLAHRQLGEVVRVTAGEGEALGIWGWRSSLYVETGLRQATRQAHTHAQLVAGRWHGYFQHRYFADLKMSNPPVFVDAVGPGNFRFDDRRLGHEIFPLLREWVSTHYILVTELDGVRVYARHDRVAVAQRALAQAGL